MLRALVLAVLLPVAALAEGLTRHVDPFIGTDGTGHTFPGAAVPFGMVAPSPDNADSGWDYTSGYQYRAPRILGFSNTHMSGTGIGDLGDVLLQPASATRWSSATQDFSSAYDKRSERAQPGYYAVTLRDHGVRVELTATQRVALHRYTFDRPGRVQVLADFAHVLHFKPGPRASQSEVTVTAAAGEIAGSQHVSNWAERHLAFALRFNRPIEHAETLPPALGEQAPRYLLTFDLGSARVLEARVALSTVDAAGARRNLAEAAALDFDGVRTRADRAWAELLDRVSIEAPARQQRIFYTALYHALLHPSDVSDLDGRVRGPTGTVIRTSGGYYSTLSLWDVSRGQFPLLALIVPERIDGIVRTLLDHHAAQGYLPLFTVWGGETWCMIGNPSLPIIAHAVNAGFRGFDREAALAAMVASSTEPRPSAPEWAQRDWAVYEQFGYLPFDRVRGESVSQALEYGWGDDAVARVARALGRQDIAARFAARSQGYRRLFDPGTRTMRGRDAAGNWRTPFDPLAATSPLNNPGDYTEANAWQYTATPGLHDPQGFVELLGGPRAAGEWLDRFFTLKSPAADRFLGQEGVIGQYAHGNEPSHHVAYLYAWTDRPWRGHELVRRIVRDFYGDGPDGITGNDDAGQMSAWYVLSTLGIYPVVAAGAEYVIGAPQVRAATLRVAGGRLLRIRADGFGAGRPFAQGVRFNGTRVPVAAMPYQTLAAGGELRFSMQAVP